MKTEIIETQWAFKPSWSWKVTNGSWRAHGEEYSRRRDAVRGLARFLQRVKAK